MDKVINQEIGNEFALYNADCMDVIATMDDNSIDFSIFSPPFVDLFCYSSSERDFGNSKNYAEFFERFDFLSKELLRVVKPGRLIAVHCIDIPAMKERDGYIGLKDFPGDIIKSFQKSGAIYHSRVTIWKDPLIEATRTKAIGLMHKQLCKDSTMCRMGLPDYLVVFRVPGENQAPVEHKHGISKYVGSEPVEKLSGNRSHNIWRAYASPIWDDIRQTEVLKNYRNAREEADEKHICPLQTDVIERCVMLWSNPGEVVFTPFMGIGSECYGAIINARKAIGVELKTSYYEQAVKNVKIAASKSFHDQKEWYDINPTP